MGEVAISCGVPAGFHQLEPGLPEDRLDLLEETLAGLPAAAQGRPAEVLADYRRALAALREQDVLLCAFGLHQDDRGEPHTSVLTLSARPLAGAAPGPLLGGLRARALGEGQAAADVLLPSGPALLLERRERPDGERWLWTASVALAAAAHDRVLLLQLCSAATGLTSEYREILLGAAHTLDFPVVRPPRSRITEALG